MPSPNLPRGIPTDPQVPQQIHVPSITLETGRILASRYEVRGHLGGGGMGTVYRVHDRDLSEEIALKVISDKQVHDPQAVERLRREVKLARKIAHRNVCKVFDYGEADGLRFLTMELIEGTNLRTGLVQGIPNAARVAEIILQIAAGLSAVHELGMVHRDIKPENVVVRQNGEAVLVDFGLARQIETSQSEFIAGTPAYMSPEQLEGKHLDHRSDIFALGVLAYELFTTQSPFDRGSFASTSAAIMRDEPPALQSSIVPVENLPHVQAVLARAMAKTSDDRFDSALSFAEALQKSLINTSELASTIQRPQNSSMKQSVQVRRLTRRQLFVLGILLALAIVGGALIAVFATSTKPAHWAIFRIHDEVRLVSEIEERQRRAREGTSNLEARKNFAQYLQDYRSSIVRGTSDETYRLAKHLLDEAIRLDPAYVPALVERAYLHARANGGAPTPGQLSYALADVDGAVALAPRDSQALMMRCRVLAVVLVSNDARTDSDMAMATRACDDALIQDPYSADAHLVFAKLHDLVCRDRDAMKSAEMARASDHRQTGRALEHLVEMALNNGDHEKADIYSQELLQFEENQRSLGALAITMRSNIPANLGAPFWRAAALLVNGQEKAAQTELEKQIVWLGQDTSGDPVKAAAMRGILYRFGNPSAEMRTKYEAQLARDEDEFKRDIPKNPLAAIEVASYYEWIDPTKAVEWIELAKGADPGNSMRSCEVSIRIAGIYKVAGKLEEARAEAARCSPHFDWEKSCLDWTRRQLLVP